MKLKYGISFRISCFLSIISVFFANLTQAVELNQDFNIETLSGDVRIIDELGLSAVIQNGRNDYSIVTLTATGAKIEPTIYDDDYGLDGRQLEHRELYRHAPWASVLETEDYMISYEFDHTYNWNSRFDPSTRIAVLNKNSGDTQVLNHTFTDIPRYIEIYWDTYLVKKEETFYYVLMTNTFDLLVYTFNPETLTLNLDYRNSLSDSISAHPNSWFDLHASEEFIYIRSEGIEIYEFNPATQSIEPITIKLSEDKSIADDNMFAINFGSTWFYEDQIIFEGQDQYYEPTGIYHIVNRDSGNFSELEQPSFAKLLEDEWPIENHTVLGNHFVLNYQVTSMTPETQFIAVYDLETHELIYEGSLKLRKDQGLLTNGWGTINGFSVK